MGLLENIELFHWPLEMNSRVSLGSYSSYTDADTSSTCFQLAGKAERIGNMDISI